MIKNLLNKIWFWVAVSTILVSSSQASCSDSIINSPSYFSPSLKGSIFLDPSSYVTTIDTINKNVTVTAILMNCTNQDYKIYKATLNQPASSVISGKNLGSKANLTFDKTLILPKQTFKIVTLTASAVNFTIDQCDLVKIDFLFVDSNNMPNNPPTEDDYNKKILSQPMVFFAKSNNVDVCKNPATPS